jgi:hypothetical protein
MVSETYTSRITLSEMLYIPQASCSLISIPQATEEGATARFRRGVNTFRRGFKRVGDL